MQSNTTTLPSLLPLEPLLWGLVCRSLVTPFTRTGGVQWRKQWHPTPVLLPGKSHGQRSLVGCSPWGREESDTTERLHSHFSLSCIGEGNGNPLQCSCLENPRDGGAWWAAVYGVAQSRKRLKRLISRSSSSSRRGPKVECERTETLQEEAPGRETVLARVLPQRRFWELSLKYNVLLCHKSPFSIFSLIFLADYFRCSGSILVFPKQYFNHRTSVSLERPSATVHHFVTKF